MTTSNNSIFEFRLPDVGEGLEDAEIVRWLISAGDEIVVNQIIVEIESAKSLVELPTPFTGTVLEILVEVGRVVRVGTPIVRIQLLQSDASGAPEPDAKTERTEILVGSGPRTEDGQGALGLVGTHVDAELVVCLG